MYETYFALQRAPFALTPDPRFLYLSAQHREALAHLLYGTGEGGGFVQLTGEVGTGKTTVCRALLSQLPESVDAALLFNPPRSVDDLLTGICRELGISGPGEAAPVEALNAHLLESNARGRRTVLLVDEAQNLPVDVLEQIRLLTNLETDDSKLLQVFLVGQPELRRSLASPALRQVAQRVTARFHLRPMTREETAAYITHRLAVAGCDRALFTPAAIAVVHRRASGLPRLVNILCDRALLGAYATGRPRVTAGIVRRAARELGGGPARASRRRWAAAGLAGLLLASVTATALWQNGPPWQRAPAGSAAAPEPVATRPPPPGDAPDARAWLEGVLAAPGSDADAQRRLLALWGVAGDADGEASLCARAEAAGLRCHRTRGDWAQVASLDRPALLTLERGPDRGQVLLTGLGLESATIAAADGPRTVPRTALDAAWTGDLVTLWRPSPTGVELIDRGAPVAAIRWLRDSLHRLHGDPELREGAARYDAQLVEHVRRFQAERGIAVDGIVGRETLMHLRSALDSDTVPRLERPGGEIHHARSP